MFHVGFCCFRCVMRCMVQMSLSRMCVMRRDLVVSRLVMSCGFAVMLTGMLKVFRRFMMVFRRLLGHLSSSVLNSASCCGREVSSLVLKECEGNVNSSEGLLKSRGW
jgi:hypothetical protein